jgi:hypothetical protein
LRAIVENFFLVMVNMNNLFGISYALVIVGLCDVYILSVRMCWGDSCCYWICHSFAIIIFCYTTLSGQLFVNLKGFLFKFF